MMKSFQSNRIFEALRYVDMKEHPEHAILMVPAAQRLIKKLGGLHAIWLFTGARYGNIGLVNCANKLGKDAEPIIAGLKAMRPDIEAKATAPLKAKDKAQMEKLLKTVDKCIADYEAKYGKVEPAKPVVDPSTPQN